MSASGQTYLGGEGYEFEEILDGYGFRSVSRRGCKPFG
jgi:hypothetical protein